MKAVAVFCVLLRVFIRAEQFPDLQNDPRLPQAVSTLMAEHSCDQQLIEPLAVLLYTNSLAYMSLCNSSEIYFNGCRDPMLLECKDKLKNNDNCATYMSWIDAFVAEGKKFTCSLSYENLTAVLFSQGGFECAITETGANLTHSVTELLKFISDPKKIECSEMTPKMFNIVTVLANCKSNSLRNLVQDYFKQVLRASPCPIIALQTDPQYLKAASVFSSSPSCDQQLLQPLNVLLYPQPATYELLCNPSTVYFQDCRDPMMIECKAKLKNEDMCATYMYWIDAFIAEGRKFTCSVGYANLTDILVQQGGFECTVQEVGNNLTQSLSDLLNFLSEPKSIECSDMERKIQNVLTVLDSCKSNSLFNLVQDYFKQVVSASPCNVDGNSGVGAPSVSNVLILVSTTIFYAFISFIL